MPRETWGKPEQRSEQAWQALANQLRLKCQIHMLCLICLSAFPSYFSSFAHPRRTCLPLPLLHPFCHPLLPCPLHVHFLHVSVFMHESDTREQIVLHNEEGQMHRPYLKYSVRGFTVGLCQHIVACAHTHTHYEFYILVHGVTLFDHPT